MSTSYEEATSLYYRPELNDGTPIEDQRPYETSILNLYCTLCDEYWTRTHKAFMRNPHCPTCTQRNSSVLVTHPYLKNWLVDSTDSLKFLSSRSSHNATWQCPQCSFVFMATIKNVASSSNPCGRCNPQAKKKNGGLFKANYPQYVEQLITPTSDDFFIGTHETYEWAMPCSHTMSSRPLTFLTDPLRCETCRNEETVHIADDHFQSFLFKNKVMSSGSQYVASCQRCGSRYPTTIKSLKQKFKNDLPLTCPSCIRRAPRSGTLEDRIASWSCASWSDLNDTSPHDYSYSSGQRVYWQCRRGHTWDTFAYAAQDSCPKCQGSSQENELASFFECRGLSFVRNTRSVIAPYELDFYFPELKIAIEFNGLYWHTEDRLGRTYHRDKSRRCSESGIQLITVWEDDWQHHKEVIHTMLLRKLGVSSEPRINARQCSIVTLDYSQARDFLNLHHVQGSMRGSIYYGLKHGEDVVAVMVLRKNKDALYLERYATSCIVRGGFSRLLKQAKSHVPLDVTRFVTFSDNDVSNGNLYSHTGWIKDATIPEDYMYVVKHQRVHKFNYRLERFRKDQELTYVEGLSESDLAELNHLPRIWGTEKIRWVLPIVD